MTIATGIDPVDLVRGIRPCLNLDLTGNCWLLL